MSSWWAFYEDSLRWYATRGRDHHTYFTLEDGLIRISILKTNVFDIFLIHPQFEARRYDTVASSRNLYIVAVMMMVHHLAPAKGCCILYHGIFKPAVICDTGIERNLAVIPKFLSISATFITRFKSGYAPIEYGAEGFCCLRNAPLPRVVWSGGALWNDIKVVHRRRVALKRNIDPWV